MTRPPFDPFKRPRLYILDEHHRPVPCPNILDQARWMMTGDPRRVRLTTTQHYSISTIFLGIDHNHSGVGPPILFETMVFEHESHERPDGKGGTYIVHEDHAQERYATWDDAITGHEAMVRRWRKIEADAAAQTKIGIKNQQKEKGR